MALILDKTEQKIVDIIDAHRNEIIAFAKDIYTHAELGYKEYRTAEKFASFMKNLGLETKEGLAVTGVKAYLNEEEKTNVSLALIGEMKIKDLHGPEAYKEGLKLNHGRRPMVPLPNN